MKMAAARAVLAGALLAGVEGLSPKGPQGQWDVAIQVRREWSPCFGTCLPPSLPACPPCVAARARPGLAGEGPRGGEWGWLPWQLRAAAGQRGSAGKGGGRVL